MLLKIEDKASTLYPYLAASKSNLFQPMAAPVREVRSAAETSMVCLTGFGASASEPAFRAVQLGIFCSPKHWVGWW